MTIAVLVNVEEGSRCNMRWQCIGLARADVWIRGWSENLRWYEGSAFSLKARSSTAWCKTAVAMCCEVENDAYL
jgi:hypothetical protein